MGIFRFIHWRKAPRSWKRQRREEEAREKIDIVLAAFAVLLILKAITDLLN